MAQKNNYVKVNTCPDENDKIDLAILFISGKDETVFDIQIAVDGFITTYQQEMIHKWIFDGISPADFEDEEAIRRKEIEAYGKPYNR